MICKNTIQITIIMKVQGKISTFLSEFGVQPVLIEII